MSNKKRPLESDEEVERKLRETKAAWDIVTRADSERDSTGRAVARSMGNFDFSVLEVDPSLGARDNQTTDDENVCKESDVDKYVARCMEYLGILPGVFSEPIASLILNSVDPEYRVPLRNLPQHAISVERCFAHVDALRLPMRTEGMVSMARVVTLALLNRVTTRGVRNVSPVQEPEDFSVRRIEPEVQTSYESSAVPLASAPDDQAMAPPGRTVVGFVTTKKDSYWVVDGERVAMKAGEPLLKLAPTAMEREKVAERDPQGLSKLVVVWWQNAPRRLDEDKVVAVRRSDYLEHLERERNFHAN